MESVGLKVEDVMDRTKWMKEIQNYSGDPRYEITLREKISVLINAIGLYRDVWIAAIASSTTSLATRTAAICVRFQGRRVRHNADYVPYAKIRFDL